MPKAAAIILLLFIGMPILLAAQEAEIDPDWDYYYDDYYTRGDQTFTISLGTIFPALFFSGDGTNLPNKFSPRVGGTGSLSYSYFLGAKFFVGGEVGLLFVHTLGDNTLLSIPLSVKTGFQFSAGKLEIPIDLSVGMVWHRYLDLRHYGLFAKAGGGLYYRFFPNWSFGINTHWFWFPQWTGNEKQNVQGNMIDITLSARYHF